jgi:hypothetical protein
MQDMSATLVLIVPAIADSDRQRLAEAAFARTVERAIHRAPSRGTREDQHPTNVLTTVVISDPDTVVATALATRPRAVLLLSQAYWSHADAIQLALPKTRVVIITGARHTKVHVLRKCWTSSPDFLRHVVLR